MTMNLRSVCAFFAFVAFAALAAAYTAQYVFGLQPCVLCLYQRVPYAIILVGGLIGFFKSARAQCYIITICIFTFLAGASIALFQVGVEQHWWQGTTACGGGALDTSSLEALRAQIMNAHMVRCDVVAWSFFGISMAGYNLLTSLVLSVFGAFALKKRPLKRGSSKGQGA
jgi:disulfide bond formation protein DsbB